ncbi:hypothetical protein R1sor_006645 [Riccia sorocarpa]|uniref:Kinesin motor domain-containing protein n=1 Tax=Riccia sorocarpa TaxID=122646 RepID=A0ABD3HR52_9MARC
MALNQVHNTKNPDIPPKLFTFDRTYGSSSTQREVYDDVAHSIVHSVMCGYNGTILAYGQTASSKTFTMDGLVNPQNSQNPHRLELKESGDTGVYVKNLTSVTVQSVPDINRLLLVHHFYTTPYTPG